MTKLQLLHRAVNERLMAAVEQIMEMVGGVLLEYEEETIRVRKENEELRRNLRWKQESNSAEWADSSEKPTIPIPEETSPSNEDERPASPRFELNSDVADIENNSTVRPLSGPEIMVTLMKAQENAQSFMAPMEYDLSLQASRFRLWKEQNTRQKMSFACPDCGKVFAKKQTLLVHMRIHSNDSPRYTCRERKTFFYGNSRKGKKKYGLSQTQHHDHSKHDEDDLMDDSVETNNTTAPEAYTDVGQEKLDETTFDNKESILIKYNVTGTKSKRRRKGKKRLYTLMQCPVCPDRTLAGHAQFTMHMRTHKHDMNQCTPSQSTTDEAATMETEVPKSCKEELVEKLPNSKEASAGKASPEPHTRTLHQPSEKQAAEESNTSTCDAQSVTKKFKLKTGKSKNIKLRGCVVDLPKLHILQTAHLGKLTIREMFDTGGKRSMRKRKFKLDDVKTEKGIETEEEEEEEGRTETNHTGDKPYHYRQRIPLFYGEVPNRNLSGLEVEEPLMNCESLEETMNESSSLDVNNSGSNSKPENLVSSPDIVAQEIAAKPGILPQLVIGGYGAFDKKIPKNAKRASYDLKDFNLQPMIVLEPVERDLKYWSFLPEALKSRGSERRVFDHDQISSVVVGDEKTSAETSVDSKAVDKCFAHGVENMPEMCCNFLHKTEIISVVVSSPQHDSPLAEELPKESLQTNQTSKPSTPEHRQEEISCSFPCASDQLLSKVDENQDFRSSPSEHLDSPGKSDSIASSSIRLTLLKQNSDFESWFKNTDAAEKKDDLKSSCVVLSDDEELVEVLKETCSNIMENHGPSDCYVLSDTEDDVLEISSYRLQKNLNTCVLLSDDDEKEESPSKQKESSDAGTNLSCDSTLKAPDTTDTIQNESKEPTNRNDDEPDQIISEKS
ncbi:hypothetical protein DNTS_017849 [Danionella cerebrum]|uniref:C2H2-type domain-containing protein n=1 Tax=Danionella cerebrum TaxID=2873325 RepID=A0A553R0F2_9TELE|nr:hypothetical protein DNTS_017849 [Danionella translucida]